MRYERATLGDAVERTASWNPRRSTANEPLLYIDLSTVDRQTKTIRAVPEVLAHDAPSRARQLVQAGDVLVSTVRPNLNGVAVVPPSLDGATASTGFTVLRPSPDRLDGRYLFNWVRSPYFVQDMTLKATGASYPAVSDKTVLASQLPLPPIDEQRRIAAILDKADGIRRKRREAIAMTEELLRSTFLEMFGDPVTNPKGWRTAPLHTVAEVNSGITKNRRLAPEDAEEVPYMRVANVQDGYLNLDEIKTIPVAKDKVEQYLLRVGDVLLTEGGDPDKLGRGAVWRGQIEKCVHQNHIFSVRVNRDHLIPEFASAVIGSDRGKRYFLKAGKQTTGIASINKTQLKNFEILLPPLSAQLAYESAVNGVRTLEGRLSEVAAATDDLFESLVQRAFGGEL